MRIFVTVFPTGSAAFTLHCRFEWMRATYTERLVVGKAQGGCGWGLFTRRPIRAGEPVDL